MIHAARRQIEKSPSATTRTDRYPKGLSWSASPVNTLNDRLAVSRHTCVDCPATAHWARMRCLPATQCREVQWGRVALGRTRTELCVEHPTLRNFLRMRSTSAFPFCFTSTRRVLYLPEHIRSVSCWASILSVDCSVVGRYYLEWEISDGQRIPSPALHSLITIQRSARAANAGSR